MSRNTLIILALVVFVIGGIAFLPGLFGRENEVGQNVAPSPTVNNAPVQLPTEVVVDEGGEVKVFEVEGSNYEFSVKEMRVNRGDTVRIEFTSMDGIHDWRVDEFGMQTERLAAGESGRVEFVADEVGSFEYYCSVNNHRAMGMVGTLVVE